MVILNKNLNKVIKYIVKGLREVYENMPRKFTPDEKDDIDVSDDEIDIVDVSDIDEEPRRVKIGDADEEDIDESEIEDDIDDTVETESVDPGDTDDIEKISEEVEELEEEFEPIAPKTAVKFHIRYIVVPPEKRITSNIITKTEMTELTSIRASQISKHPKVMTDVEGLTDPIRMAKKEFNDRKTPLILERSLGSKTDEKAGEILVYVEYWDPKTMGRPFVYDIS